MSATSFALALQGFDPINVLLLTIGLPVVVIFWVVNIMRTLIGCDLTGLWIVVFALYAGYHSWVEAFDDKAMLIWLTSATGMVLLMLDCHGDFDLAMLLQAPRVVNSEEDSS